jgi:hypothetical protein
MKNAPLPLLSTTISKRILRDIAAEVSASITPADSKLLTLACVKPRIIAYMTEAYLANQPDSLLTAIYATNAWHAIESQTHDMLCLSEDDVRALAGAMRKC